MELKEGYKQTDIGVIPQEWAVKKLADISKVKTGPFGSALHEKDYVLDGTPIITVEHLGERGVSHKNLPMVSDIDRVRLKTYELQIDDIVFSRVGSIDRNSLIRISENGWLFSGRLLRIRLNDRKVDAQYLSYHFHQESFKQRVKSVAVGQTMPSLNTQILNGIDVVIPPLVSEQKAIAQALSDTDALITALDALIAKKRLIKQGTMQQLLTGKRRLDGFTEGWKFDKIKNQSSITTGSKNTQDRVEDGNFPFFVRSQTVERINSYSFDGEAVLTAGDGVGTGKVIHYINGKFDCHQRVYKISNFSKDLDGYFFYIYFRNNFLDRVMSMTAKSSVDSVRMEMIADMEIPIPPVPEQKAIAQILSDMDTEIATLEAKRDKYKQVKQGMMQELLTGKTRLTT